MRTHPEPTHMNCPVHHPLGQPDAAQQDAGEPPVEDLADGAQEIADHAHVVIADRLGRGRSCGMTVSVPIWMNPATASPSVQRRKSIMKTGS